MKDVSGNKTAILSVELAYNRESKDKLSKDWRSDSRPTSKQAQKKDNSALKKAYTTEKPNSRGGKKAKTSRPTSGDQQVKDNESDLERENKDEKPAFLKEVDDLMKDIDKNKRNTNETATTRP
jgi:hypothetical protein